MAAFMNQGWQFAPQVFPPGGIWPTPRPFRLSGAQAWPLQKQVGKNVAVFNAAKNAGKKLVSQKRYKGKMQEWSTQKKFGWIEPVEDLDYLPPDAKPTDGFRPKIFVHMEDLQKGTNPAVGMLMEFALYKDAKGMGAFACKTVAEAVNLEDEEVGGSPEATVIDAEAGKAASESAVAGADSDSTGKDAPLPEGWERHWSEEHQTYFYWHGESQETSWSHPSLVQDESTPHLSPGLVEEGWETHFDEQRERWYYWNKLTQESAWEEPVAKGAPKSSTQATRRPGGFSAAATGAASAQKGIAKGSQAEAGHARGVSVGEDDRVRGRINQSKRLFAWITPFEELETELQPMLKRFKGCVYANRRDTASGLEAEMEVDFVLKRDEHGLTAVNVQPLQEAATPKGPDVSEQLPPGWSMQWSEEHESHYYWNEVTQEPSWERPSLPSTVVQEASVESEPVDDQVEIQNGAAPRSISAGVKQSSKGGKATVKAGKVQAGGGRLAELVQSKDQSKGKNKGKAGSPQLVLGKPTGKSRIR